MPESPEPQIDTPSRLPFSHRPIEKLRELLPYGLIIAAFMAGFTIGSQLYAASNRNLEGEISRIRGDFAEYRAQHSSKSEESRNNSANSPTTHQPDSKVSGDQGMVTVEVGKSGSVFAGDLLVSVIETKYVDDRYKVIAKFGSPGYEPLAVQRVDVGSRITYNGKDNYEMRILAANSFSVKFLVTRSQK